MNKTNCIHPISRHIRISDRPQDLFQSTKNKGPLLLNHGMYIVKEIWHIPENLFFFLVLFSCTGK